MKWCQPLLGNRWLRCHHLRCLENTQQIIFSKKEKTTLHDTNVCILPDVSAVSSKIHIPGISHLLKRTEMQIFPEAAFCPNHWWYLCCDGCLRCSSWSRTSRAHLVLGSSQKTQEFLAYLVQIGYKSKSYLKDRVLAHKSHFFNKLS